MNRKIVLAQILIIVISTLSIFTVNPVNAQTIPTPSVPQFTVKFVNESYNMPAETTNTTNPYTGKQTVTTVEGYYVQNDSFAISIRNQPFNISSEVNGSEIALYYIIQWKGHFSNQWSNVTFVLINGSQYLAASNGDYTTIVYGLVGNNDTAYNNPSTGYGGGFEGAGFIGGEYGGQVDIRVSAVIGYYTTIAQTPALLNNLNPYQTIFVALKSSDWSKPLTISIVNGSTSTSIDPSTPYPSIQTGTTATPMPTAAVPELSWLAIIPVLLALLSIAAILRHRKINL